MQIAVIGLGKIGRTLAAKLDEEGHTIRAMDHNADVVNSFVNQYENIYGIVGEAFDVRQLQDIDVERADVVIAATDADEMNVLCCLIAKGMGAKKAVARVRKPEYASNLDFFTQKLGIDLIINPERAVASEISRILRFRSVLSAESLANNKMEIVRLKVTEESPLNGVVLSKMQARFKANVLVCAVVRDEKITIPDGTYVLQTGDIIYLTAGVQDFSVFFKNVVGQKDAIHSILLVGGGKISRYLAIELATTGREVCIVEKNAEKAAALESYFTKEGKKIEVYTADGAIPEQMEEINLKGFDALVAMTDMDEINYMLSMYAASRSVQKIVTKINNNIYADMMNKQNIATVVCTKEVVSDQLVAYIRSLENADKSSKIEAMYSLVDGKLNVMEFVLEKDASYIGKALKDLKKKQNFLIIGIMRNGVFGIPNGNDILFLNDHVIVITTNINVDSIDEIME